MGNEELEMRILNAHIPFPVSKLSHLKKRIELGPEKWEMGIKREVGSEEMGNKKDVEPDPEKWEMRLKREFS